VDTYLEFGDHALDSRGLPYLIGGVAQLLQQVWIRLTVKRGGFLLDPTLGSELYRLKRTGVAQLEETALSYIQDALYPMKGVTVDGLTCTYDSRADRLTIALNLRVEGSYQTLEVQL